MASKRRTGMRNAQSSTSYRCHRQRRRARCLADAGDRRVPEKLDCSALQKQSNGWYLVTKITSIIVGQDSSFAFGEGAVIGPEITTANRGFLRDLIAQKCAAGSPQLTAGTPNWVAAEDLAELSLSFGSATAGPAGDIRSFFLGTWESEAPGRAGTEGPAKMVLTLGGDGKVDGHYVVHLTGSGATASIPVSGSWSVTRAADKVANLKFALVVHGNNGQQQPVNSAATLEIIAQNTVRDTAQGSVSKRGQSMRRV